MVVFIMSAVGRTDFLVVDVPCCRFVVFINALEVAEVVVEDFVVCFAVLDDVWFCKTPLRTVFPFFTLASWQCIHFLRSLQRCSVIFHDV